MLLLHDGTVLVQDQGFDGSGSPNWWRLAPDNSGSYLTGTWSRAAALPHGYTPQFFASQVLADGTVIINGGEYNGSGTQVETNLGARFDPVKNAWTPVPPPTGWSNIGDAQSTLLNDGTYMLANALTSQEALLNLKTMAWSATGSGKADANSEEGWTLLPGGSVLTVDVDDAGKSEIYANGSWSSAGQVPVALVDQSVGEIGPQMLRPDGTVLVVGATGKTAIYTLATHAWSAGPDFPKYNAKAYYDEADGPAALLPDGNVLVAASPGNFLQYSSPTAFFEIAGNKVRRVAATPNAGMEDSFQIRLLLLPTGQVLETDGTGDAEIYSSNGKPQARLAPKITKFAATVTRGQAYTLAGRHLSGYSQAVAYGDDYQAATNYPLVRITNTATGHVYYASTDNPSSFAVASAAVVTASVTIPGTLEAGAATLEVVANGIASAALNINVK